MSWSIIECTSWFGENGRTPYVETDVIPVPPHPDCDEILMLESGADTIELQDGHILETEA